MTASKTNERIGTRATLRGYQMSASKARVVLNIIRGEDVTTAREILAGTTREAADVIGKVLASAVANAVSNDEMIAEELYVSAAYADEGMTMKRFSPRARGRAGKIFKRSTHITVIVSRMDEERLELMRRARSAQAQASRSRRVASSRRRADQTASVNKREAAHEARAELEAAQAVEHEAQIASSVDEAPENDVTADTPIDTIDETDDVETGELTDRNDEAVDIAEENEEVSTDTEEETN
ncbi:MAG: 50S ribosomal protein L22 [Acidimicrobiales bacterium]